MSIIKKLVPLSVKENLKTQVIRFSEWLSVKSDQLRYRSHFCPVCNSKVFQFLPMLEFEMYMKYQVRGSIFAAETFNFTQYRCPYCKANDRDRLFALYLKEIFAGLDKSKKYRFIDFAPETISLGKFIKSQPFLDYRSADLYMQGVDDKVDLQDMKIYANNSTDMFICSHILEHVDDDRKAMNELYRILKPGGWGIVMVPIQLDIDEMYENPSITSPEERWHHFGQDTHVRTYSKKGFVERLKGTGFTVLQLGSDHFGKEIMQKNGIYPRSILYVVQK